MISWKNFLENNHQDVGHSPVNVGLFLMVKTPQDSRHSRAIISLYLMDDLSCTMTIHTNGSTIFPSHHNISYNDRRNVTQMYGYASYLPEYFCNGIVVYIRGAEKKLLVILLALSFQIAWLERIVFWQNLVHVTSGGMRGIMGKHCFTYIWFPVDIIPIILLCTNTYWLEESEENQHDVTAWTFGEFLMVYFIK